MRRREFIALIGASVASPFAAMAQQAGRTYRIGSLYPAQQPDVNTTNRAPAAFLRAQFRTSGSEAPASLLSEDDVVVEASSERAGT